MDDERRQLPSTDAKLESFGCRISIYLRVEGAKKPDHCLPEASEVRRSRISIYMRLKGAKKPDLYVPEASEVRRSRISCLPEASEVRGSRISTYLRLVRCEEAGSLSLAIAAPMREQELQFFCRCKVNLYSCRHRFALS